MPSTVMVRMNVLVPKPLKKRIAVALASREEKLSPLLRDHLERWVEEVEKEQVEKHNEHLARSQKRS